MASTFLTLLVIPIIYTYLAPKKGGRKNQGKVVEG
jgi:hypothetical protein